MIEMKGKTAVITGGASGIGLSLAKACGRRGMRVVLADIEEGELRRSSSALEAEGIEVCPLRTDVTRTEDVERLAEKSAEAFGGVDLLFNNAGVGAGGFVWNSHPLDWSWTFEVNLWGVVRAVNAFLPVMNAGSDGCRIVNTVSRAAIETGPFNGPYRVSKHALLAYSETLYHELAAAGSKVGVSVICPGNTRTRICDADRNRPSRFGTPARKSVQEPFGAVSGIIRKAVEAGASPDAVAEYALKAIGEGRFYILPDEDSKSAALRRAALIAAEASPEFAIPPAADRV